VELFVWQHLGNKSKMGIFLVLNEATRGSERVNWREAGLYFLKALCLRRALNIAPHVHFLRTYSELKKKLVVNYTDK